MVSKSRRKQTVTMDDVYKEYNDWSKFNRDSNVQQLMSPEKSPYPKDSSMAKLNKDINKLSSDKVEKIKKANEVLLFDISDDVQQGFSPKKSMD